MKKQNKNHKFKWQKWQILTAVAIIALIIIGLAAFLSRGWIRQAYYAHQAKSAFQTELKNLAEPLKAFGLAYQSTNCTTDKVADYNQPKLQCVATGNSYKVIGKNKADKVSFVAKAGQLDQLLKSNGWTETQNAAPSYKQWFEGITSGKDWLPDEGAYKNVGNVHCGMDIMLAFAKPKPPAFNIVMNCTSPRLAAFDTYPS